jgi:hypothetical protein
MDGRCLWRTTTPGGATRGTSAAGTGRRRRRRAVRGNHPMPSRSAGRTTGTRAPPAEPSRPSASRFSDPWRDAGLVPTPTLPPRRVTCTSGAPPAVTTAPRRPRPVALTTRTPEPHRNGRPSRRLGRGPGEVAGRDNTGRHRTTHVAGAFGPARAVARVRRGLRAPGGSAVPCVATVVRRCVLGRCAAPGQLEQERDGADALLQFGIGCSVPSHDRI